MRRLLFLIFALAGFAALIALGLWQAGKVSFKNAVVAQIDARLVSDPVALPDAPSEDADEYLPVRLSGQPGKQELHVLVSGTTEGTGYRVVTAFETDTGRRILVDRGFLSLDDKQAAPLTAPTEITGTLLWPDDLNSSTPEPDLDKNIWYARDLPEMAQALDAEPVMVVVRRATPGDPRLVPLPVDSANIRNDHLEYAITWFSLALIWAAMSALFLWRNRAATTGLQS